MIIIELFDNIFQTIVTFICGCISGIFFYRNRMRAYFLLSCFYFCYSMGTLYWTLQIILFIQTPQIFSSSEVGWLSSVLFILVMQYTLSTKEERKFRNLFQLIAVIVGVPQMLFYMHRGEILLNLLWCGIIIIIGCQSIRSLCYAKSQKIIR